MSDVRAFVSHILSPDLRPPVELVYKQVSEGTPTMATFSRPPPKREPRTLVTGIKDMRISSSLPEQEQPQLQQATVGIHAKIILYRMLNAPYDTGATIGMNSYNLPGGDV